MKKKRSIGKLGDISYLLSHYNYYLTVTHTHWIIKVSSSTLALVSASQCEKCNESSRHKMGKTCYSSQQDSKIYLLIKCGNYSFRTFYFFMDSINTSFFLVIHSSLASPPFLETLECLGWYFFQPNTVACFLAFFQLP